MTLEATEFNLSIAEEIMLLMLDDEDGSFIRLPDWSTRYALSGSVLMQLAQQSRIDSDLDKLFAIDETPTGDSVCDEILEEIVDQKRPRDIRYWVERASDHADQIREHALNGLVDKGIIEQRDEKFLWVFRARRYPILKDKAEKETKLRLLEVLFSDAIPSPRDVILLCLAHATGILNELLPKHELNSLADRIEQVRKLDLIGQSVANACWDIEISIAVSSQPQY